MCPRPGRPASSRDELAGVARVGPGVSVEVFLPEPQHFLEPRLVGADGRVRRRLVELRLQDRREGARLFVFAFARRRSLGVTSPEMRDRFAPWFEPVGRIAGTSPPGAAWYLLRRTPSAV